MGRSLVQSRQIVDESSYSANFTSKTCLTVDIHYHKIYLYMYLLWGSIRVVNPGSIHRYN